MRNIAAELAKVFSLDVESRGKMLEVVESGRSVEELTKDLLEKFFRLDAYIDSLR